MWRREIEIQGVVQGVGFRPFVCRLAQRLSLSGSVRNNQGSLRIEVEGPAAQVRQFCQCLQTERPELARIDSITIVEAEPRGASGFFIAPSDPESRGAIRISPDIAPCEDCLRELHNPADRRFEHPFLSCVNCGPRLSIIEGSPYDRERTTMSVFPLCSACRKEYEDPTNRRFHAEPIACPACGPTVEYRESARRVAGKEGLKKAAESLKRGKIGALKGIGGFHLVCDATNNLAVRELRRRKHRCSKPFAVMVPSVEWLEQNSSVDAAEASLLVSPSRPIVLCRKGAALSIARETAPGVPWMGWMLPNSPLHVLLLEAVGRPLVVTSGNLSDEPLVFQDEEAESRLGGLIDFLLTHDRSIQVREDDSVMRVASGKPILLRRSRGFCPAAISLPTSSPKPFLAVGAQMKSTFCLVDKGSALLSPHIGDLDDFQTRVEFENLIGYFEQLFRLTPEWLVHDLHPDYGSTLYCQERSRSSGIGCIAIQHHHAHFAAVLADNSFAEEAIGVIWDGTGYGPDQTVWGGEFFTGSIGTAVRAASFRPLTLPGGELAIRETWRMAASHVQSAGALLLLKKTDPLLYEKIEKQEALLKRGPLTSSVGRLFDAVSALLGLRTEADYDGQSPLELEGLASGESESFLLPWSWEEQGVLTVNPASMIEAILSHRSRGIPSPVLAHAFHLTLAEIALEICSRLRKETGLNHVALGGGVFCNALLTQLCVARLQEAGFEVLMARQVPPNDGGLCLGQAAVAADWLQKESIACASASREK